MTSPTGVEDEFYDDTSDEFPSVNDLVVGAHNKIKDQVNGRLVAIWARENGVGKVPGLTRTQETRSDARDDVPDR
jgi:hypothetical protein